jgi:hypothetical protein
MDEQQEFDDLIKERFQKLPKVVQDAIESADVEAHLRELANKHQLHVDKWEILQNEVQLTLLGVKPPSDLAGNLASELQVAPDVAEALAKDVSETVFEPIREELERELDHPDAKPAEVSDVEALRTQTLNASDTPQHASELPMVLPATPPPPPPEKKVERAAGAPAYKPGEVSADRSAAHTDPYREPPQP